MKIGEDEVPRVRNLRNVIYGPLPRNRLDVYPPRRSQESAPVVLFLHGGSWRWGDKALYPWLGRALARRGFMTVIPNYRLFPQAAFPFFMEDAALAIAWTRRNAARYGGDPRRIHLMGHSAGAHMAALLALDGDYLALAELEPSNLHSIVGLAGPYAMDPLKTESVRPIFEGAPDMRRVRPIKMVHHRVPPMLLLHGARDSTVPPRQSDLFHDALQETGASARKVIYPGVGHIELLLTLAPLYRWRAPVLRDVLNFLTPAEEPGHAAPGDAPTPLVPRTGPRRASG